MHADLGPTVISQPQLAQRVAEMGEEIAAAYADIEDGLMIVAVMAGSVIFLADLVRRLPIKLKTGPRSLRTAVLLRKPGKAPTDVPVDIVGFDIQDAFVVSYGLDYDGLYRNLPYVAELRCQSGTTSCHQ